MKLLRYGPKNNERPGMLDDDGKIRSLADIIDDIDGDTISPDGLKRLSDLDPSSLPLIDGDPRIGPCLGNVGKIVCVGLNYSDHAIEAGLPIPDEPILFMKSTTAISGPYDDVELPIGSVKTDWEVELGFAIGKRAKNVSEADALDHVAGYFILNEISERQWQIEQGGQWTKGKSHDTFAPLGPWFVSSDEVPDPGNLNMKLDVNGVRRQDGSTQTMIFGVATLVSYISRFMTLEPGDIISTGTPPGVGLGMKPPLYLKVGDKMHLVIDGLGYQQQTVVTAQI